MSGANAFSGPSEDLAAIRALCARYCQGVIAYDMALWRATWASDAKWVRPDAIITGRDAIADAAEMILQSFDSADFVAHLNNTQVAGERATGRCYHSEVFTKDGVIQFFLSHYDDVYVRSAEGWVFAERAFTLLEKRRFRPA